MKEIYECFIENKPSFSETCLSIHITFLYMCDKYMLSEEMMSIFRSSSTAICMVTVENPMSSCTAARQIPIWHP